VVFIFSHQLKVTNYY